MAFSGKRRSLRSGSNPLAYMGVESVSPASFDIINRDPNVNDYAGWFIGDEWENSVTKDVWKLVNKDAGVATWIRFVSAGLVQAGSNINVTLLAGIYTVNLNKSIAQPNTNAAGTEGLYSLGGVDFISNYGTQNVFLGGAGNRTLTTAEGCTAVGLNALGHINLGLDNVAIGLNALGSATETSHSVAIGNNALGSFIAPPAPNIGHNTAVGWNSLAAITTSQNNVAIGEHALPSLLSAGGNAEGGQNTFVGHNAAYYVTRMNYSTGIGYNLARNQQQAGATGLASDNILIGSASGWYWADAERGNICIGSGGLAGDTSTIRLGQTPDVPDIGGGAHEFVRQNKCFIGGIRGITTAVVDAIPVLIDSNGQLGTISSSLRYKENVDDMGSTSERLYDLRPVTFNYKDRSSEFKSFGLIAEEVEESMSELVILDREGLPETVKYLDLIPMLLNEIQKLNKRIQILESK